MAHTKTKLFIEAVPLVDKQVSGVPHSLAGMVAALAASQEVTEQFEIVLVAPKSRMHLLDRWNGLESCTRKAIPMKFRVMNGLARRNLLPPMDLLLGSGVYLFGNFFNWSLTKHSRSFTYIHDICFAVHPELVQPDNQRMLARNVPRFIKQTDYVVTVSESAKADIVSQFTVTDDKVIVAYNGVDQGMYKPYPEHEVKAVAEKYGLTKKYLMFLGNIEPRKNLARLVEAMKLVPDDYQLLLVGSDGWLNEGVFAAIDAINATQTRIIKPKQYVDDADVVLLLCGAEALVQPSIHEGFGMPPLEAVMCGTPVVLADIPPLRETLGDAGIYCDPFDVASIAAAINTVLAMPAKQRTVLAKAGAKLASTYSWGAAAASLAPYLRQARIDIRR